MQTFAFHFSISVPEVVLRVCIFLLLFYRRFRWGYEFRRIRLTQGRFAIVDVCDYFYLSRYRWYAIRSGSRYYAGRKVRGSGTIFMHRQIMRPSGSLVVDHINHDGLDNRRSNLRIVTVQQNNWHSRQGFNRGRSKYKGVRWHSRDSCWYSMISYNGRKIYLGSFSDEVSAARAYDSAARRYHGKYAVLNF